LKDPDGGERLSFDISTEAKFQREAAIRASARIAFHKSEGDAKLRRALMQRARAATRPFEHGEAVRYWNKPKDRRQGRWIGPAVVVGREGPNYWIAQGGRCRLTSPEHLRPSGPEESGEFLSMAGVKREVELLLQEDLDNEDEAENPVKLDDYHDRGDEHPRRRMKRKTPPETVEWDANLATNTSEVMMMMRRKLTRRGLEKRQEKELKWTEIPGEYRQKFRDAEEKQWREHLHFDALEPLDDTQTAWVRANIGAERVLGARWAYKDKNWSRRRQGEQVEWKCKSRLVIAGHKDPDLEKGQLSTDSPTISRPGLLCLLQVLANGLRAPDPWRPVISSELFISQPVTGFPGMKPGQLVWVKKNMFGLATSPREWWEDLQDGFRRVKIDLGEENYQFD
ncbi:GIP, partial [Symbiodinium pilosum]